MSRTQTLKLARKWHLLLVWPAMLSVLVYVLSSLAHPVANWLGPAKARFQPPSLHADAKAVNSIASIIKHNRLGAAHIAKLVPYEDRVLLQVTQGSGQEQSRRYFSTQDYSELAEHDRQQAIWLAQQYVLGQPKVKFVEYISEFNDAYPKSQRLLPVYKIHYQTADNLSAIVHTESLALVSLSNDGKRLLKSLFRMLHTFDWLNEYETVRLIVIAVLLSLLLIMSLSACYFLLVMKRQRVIKLRARRWHRRLAYVVVLPLFLFSVSGFYHLGQASLYSHDENLNLQDALDLSQWQAPMVMAAELAPLSWNQVSLVQAAGPVYRLQAARAGKPSHGMPSGPAKHDAPVYFLDAHGSQLAHYTDSALIHKKLANWFAIGADDVVNQQMLHGFEQGYSFKNKRLPVWKFELLNTHRNHVFIDPVSHRVLATNNPLTRLEGYSFSYLHMWGFLKPVLGHSGRDVIFVLLLVLTLVLSLFGLRVHLAAKRRTQATAGRQQPA